MNKLTKNNVKIYSLNTTSKALTKQWELPPHEELTVITHFVRMPNCHLTCAQEAYDKIRNEFAQFASQIPQLAADFGISAKVNVDFGIDMDVSCDWLWNDPLIVMMGEHGIYPQVGFCSGPAINVSKAVLVAMNVHDYFMFRYGSSHPDDHLPMNLDPSLTGIADDFDSVVGDTFSNGNGLWCKQLCEFRAAIRSGLVVLLEGANPTSAFKRAMEDLKNYSEDSE